MEKVSIKTQELRTWRTMRIPGKPLKTSIWKNIAGKKYIGTFIIHVHHRNVKETILNNCVVAKYLENINVFYDYI